VSLPACATNLMKTCRDGTFQRLEKSPKKFPTIGKITKKVSNDWKNHRCEAVPLMRDFQRLEKRA